MTESCTQIPDSTCIIKNISDPDLLACYGVLCSRIRKEFDISDELLNQLINDSELSESSQFIFEQYQSEMNNLIDTYKEKFFRTINRDQSESDTVYISDAEYEKCGKVVKIHKNGFVEYCNLHRYLHTYTENDTETRSPVAGISSPSDPYCYTHHFVMKEKIQIIKEVYQTAIYIFYQNFINKVYNTLYRLFQYRLTQKCDIKSVETTPELISETLNSMKKNPLIFKSKVLYQNIRDSTKQDESDPSYYYIKVYKIMSR